MFSGYKKKKAIRIILSTRNRDSCRSLFKTPKIPPLQSQYIFLLLCFVVKNMGPKWECDTKVHDTLYDIQHEDENLQTSPLLPHSCLLAVGPVKVRNPC